MSSPRPGSGVRAVAGVGLCFGSNGLVFAALLPWYPLMVERLGLSPWEFGLVVASFALGAIASSVMPSRLISRFGAEAVVIGSTVLLGVSAAALAWSTSGPMMALLLFAVGFFDAIADVAQNVIGIAVQDNLSRTILSSMHAVWSLGGLLSGAAATVAAAGGVDMRIQVGSVAVVAVACVVIGRRLVGSAGVVRHSVETDSGTDSAKESPGSQECSRSDRSKRAILLTALPLAIVAVCGTVVEDVANNWAALAAVDFAGVPTASAGIAFSVVIGSQCLGRFSGDVLVHRFGAGRIAQIGGGLIAVGGAAVVAATEPVLLLVGLALAGYGSATLVPGALSAAARIPGTGQAGGVTLVSWIMRIGFLATSPLVGVIASASSLRWGLALLVVVGVVTLLFAGRLGSRTAR